MPQMRTQTVYVNIGSSESRGRSYALETFEESGDLKRLLGLRDQLERVRKNIDEIEVYRPTKPAFRRSYFYKSFIDGLYNGCLEGLGADLIRCQKKGSGNYPDSHARQPVNADGTAGAVAP